MLKPLSLLIGWRYSRSKQRRGFVSFIALASVLGVALGITVLITVLSVMNGFDREIRSRFFSIAPHVTVNTPEQLSDDEYHAWTSVIKQDSMVKSVTPFKVGKAVLFSRESKQFDGLVIEGVDPKQQIRATDIQSRVVAGSFSSLIQDSFKLPKIIIGQSLAQRLNLSVGDTITVVVPRSSESIAGTHFMSKNFVIGGVFSAVGTDSMLAYVNLAFANKLYRGVGAQGFHVRLHDIYQASTVTTWLKHQLPPSFVISNWQSPDQFGALP